jgi:hypothetical protein
VRSLLSVSLFCLFAFSSSADSSQSSKDQPPKRILLQLERWGCRIDGAVRGEFTKRGQTDWAVLCDNSRIQTILVFWNRSELTHAELANVFDGDGVHLEGRKIRSVGRKYIIAGYHPHSDVPAPRIEHGGIEDIRSTPVVHYFYQGKWLDLEKKD